MVVSVVPSTLILVVPIRTQSEQSTNNEPVITNTFPPWNGNTPTLARLGVAPFARHFSNVGGVRGVVVSVVPVANAVDIGCATCCAKYN